MDTNISVFKPHYAVVTIDLIWINLSCGPSAKG
jgi:hypothetical protein